jgi:hypothetical protein
MHGVTYQTAYAHLLGHRDMGLLAIGKEGREFFEKDQGKACTCRGTCQ